MTMANPDQKNSKGHVMVVDDDALFRESIMRNLEEAGFEVIGYADGQSALHRLKTGRRPDIVLLDWKMPELSGIEVLKRMRQEQFAAPVMFLTVLGDQIYEEAALLGGAVDFVEKSRSFSIVLRRIELTLNRHSVQNNEKTRQNGDAFIELGPIRLALDTNRAFWKGRQVELSLSEFQLVKLLIERAGDDVSYRDLYDLVHGEGFFAGDGDIGYRTNVRAFVKRIRQKFRDIDHNFDSIENYPGFGYRWNEKGAP